MTQAGFGGFSRVDDQSHSCWLPFFSAIPQKSMTFLLFSLFPSMRSQSRQIFGVPVEVISILWIDMGRVKVGKLGVVGVGYKF